MTELLGCPFCGGDPVQKWLGDSTNHFIECSKCGCKTDIHVAAHGGSAKDDWNTRATTPTASELVEALRPFAKYATENGFGLDNKGKPIPDGEGVGWVYLTVGDFRRTKAALSHLVEE